VTESAVAPANPINVVFEDENLTFRTLAFTIVSPMVTCPSPAITTLFPFLTERIVVPFQFILTYHMKHIEGIVDNLCEILKEIMQNMIALTTNQLDIFLPTLRFF
jgi:hypothetical protein